MLTFLFWEQDRWYWVLEDDKLIGGRKKDKVFPLSSITAVVPSLPDEINLFVAASGFKNPELRDAIIIERQLALCLKFADGSFMPFHVHRCVNGTRLMTELVTRLAGHVVPDYQYTKLEIKALRSADWNRIVKR